MPTVRPSDSIKVGFLPKTIMQGTIGETQLEVLQLWNLIGEAFQLVWLIYY